VTTTQNAAPDLPPLPATPAERLALANRLYREFRALCFWHCRPDLVITEERIPLVAKGLRDYGGRRGFMLSALLRDRDERDGVEATPCP